MSSYHTELNYKHPMVTTKGFADSTSWGGTIKCIKWVG